MPLSRTSRWPLATLFIALAVLAPRLARADKVDSFIAQMTGSNDYKVRLSAALNLAKVTDKRAVPAFVKALGDSDKTVRGVAAAALGKQVTCDSKPAEREAAVDALKAAASKDGNDFVRKQAQKALDSIKALRCGGKATDDGGGPGGTCVDVGSMTATMQGGAPLKKLMRQTVQKTFKSKASAMLTEWPGGKAPTGAALKSRCPDAFHVDGTINEITVTGGTVECKVSMLLATYPEKSMFGFLKGGAQVQGGTSATDIQYAKEDCVAAVVEDLIARKIIPTIQARVKK
jgi:hypothetical protein